MSSGMVELEDFEREIAHITGGGTTADESPMSPTEEEENGEAEGPSK